jgi:hypothetical protein
MDRKYLVVSLLGHGAAAWVLWSVGQHAAGNQNEVRAADYAERATSAALGREMNELANIKAALEQGDGKDASRLAASGPAAASREQQVRKTPEQMAAAINELAQSIEQLRREAKAEQLAKLLKISKEEALKKTEQRKPPTLDPKTMTPAELSLAMGQMQRQASQALAARQDQLQRQADGVMVKGQGTGGNESTGFTGAAVGRSGATPLPLGSALDLTDATGAVHRDYSAAIAVPAVNSLTLRPGASRAIGSDGVYASRVYIDTWYMIGPFPADDSTRVAPEFPPEQQIDLDAVYLGKDRRLLKWEYTHFDRYPVVPVDGAQYAIYYGYTEIASDRERDVWLEIGGDDDSRLWLNDKLVWASFEGMKPWYQDGGYRSLRKEIDTLNLTEGSRKVHLKKGRNTLLFKLYNGQAEMFFSLVLTSGQRPAGSL